MAGSNTSDTPFDLKTPWALSVDEVTHSLDADPTDGLSSKQVQDRRELYGANRLRAAESRSVWGILLEQFKSLVVLLLAAAGLVSFLFGHLPETIAIAVVLALNTAIGFFTEYAAVRSMEALREMGDIRADVVRDGERQSVHARSLVPGDIIVIDTGDVVPADCRILRSESLEADESSLTGESVPVSKTSAQVDKETELADRQSMLYRGTVATRGSATAVVVSTGMDTQLGEISELVHSSERGRIPLEQRLDQLANTLVWVVLGVAAVVGGAGLLAGRNLRLMLETSIALAVAAIPEGLPIVATVALSYGMWRMQKRNALIRRLPSVETLGAATRICADKTGTLTENDMRVERIATSSEIYTIDTSAGDTSGVFLCNDRPVSPEEDELLRVAVETAVLANDLEGDEQQIDPMEKALAHLGETSGFPRKQLLEKYPLVETVPFDTDVNMMATVHSVEGERMVAVKGSPEAVVSHSKRLKSEANKETPAGDVDDERERNLIRRANEMAADGFRVLGLATKRTTGGVEDPYSNLEFVGFVGLLDPPRTDVPDAIARCHKAGVRTVMVTGDHPETARHIAEQIGLIQSEDAHFFVGDDINELSEMSDRDERHQQLLNTEVLARVSPQQKLQLIELLQEANQVVAMTGDGVNDAPALQSADIGVAMGERGTEVAREAADMVLLDDAFPTIAEAIEQGRVIFENIRKFVVYLLSGNIGEIALVGGAAILGAPLPLLPLQILYLNVLNDVFPARALGMGPGIERVMEQPPRQGDDAVLGTSDWRDVGIFGLLIAICVGAGFAVSLRWLDWTPAQATTVSFLGVSISRLLHVFNMREPDSPILSNEISRNGYVWGALGLDFSLLLVAVYTPVLADVLSLSAPGTNGWLMVTAMSVAPLLLGQIYLELIPDN